MIPNAIQKQAQRRKFAQLLVEGKISNETYEEWNRETGGKKLPERVKRKKAPAQEKEDDGDEEEEEERQLTRAPFGGIPSAKRSGRDPS